ncbi:MAG: hypothetical protein L3J74_18675, partial [Bacteroidales bacterium]|nr:hypothetical protein [Bacteroidales bacterium]
MRKYILVICILILSVNVIAQKKNNDKWFAKFSPGYYFDVSRLFDNYVDPTTGIQPDKTAEGKAFWGEIGYKLPNNVIVGGYVMFSSLKRKYTDLLFQGQKYLVTHQNYAINFAYEFNFGKNHKLMPSIGILLNIRSTINIDYGYEIINNQIHLTGLNFIEDDFPDLGFNLSLD